MTATHAPTDHAAHYLVRAAVTASSLYNTQPWRSVHQDGGLRLHADISRRLPIADPDGRELVIGCGAALFNIRLAMRHLGFLPRVHTFPDAADPWHLATVRWGPYARPTAVEAAMYVALPHRRTHRGPFRSAPLSPRTCADSPTSSAPRRPVGRAGPSGALGNPTHGQRACPCCPVPEHPAVTRARVRPQAA